MTIDPLTNPQGPAVGEPPNVPEPDEPDIVPPEPDVDPEIVENDD